MKRSHKNRGLQESGLVTYDEDTGEQSQISLDRSRKYESFQDILIDWQSNLGIKFDAPAKMLEALGMQGVVTPDDYTKIILGNAVPSSNLIDYLSKVYQQTMADIPEDEKASRVVFERRAFAALHQAEAGRENDLGLVPEVLTVPDRLLASQIVRLQNDNHTAPVAQEKTNKQVIDYRLTAAASTTDSLFYRFLHRKLEERAKLTRHSFDEELTRFAAKCNVHPWVLQGFMPLPKERHDEVILAIADDFFQRIALRDEQAAFVQVTEDDQQRRQFYHDAQQFFEQNTSLDIINGQHGGIRRSFGGLLGMAMQHNGMSDLSVAQRMNQRGYEVTPEQVGRWRTQASLPNPEQLECLSTVLQFDGLQRQEMKRSHDIAKAGKRISYELEKDIAAGISGGKYLNSAEMFSIILKKGGLSEYELASYLGIYPATLAAFAQGELVASSNIIDKAAQLFSLSGNAANHFGQRADTDRMRFSETASPKEHYLHNALVRTDNKTTFTSFIDALADEGSPFGRRNTLIGASTSRKLSRGDQESVLPVTVAHLADKLDIPRDSARFRMLDDIRRHAPGKPFGLMLEQYKARGGNDLGEFLRIYRQENKTSWNAMGKQIGIHEETISHIARDSRIESEVTVEKFIQGYRLNPVQEAYLWQVARGELPSPDKANPPLASARDMVSYAKAQMEQGIPKKQAANELAYHLLKYSGYSTGKLRGIISTKTISNIEARRADFENSYYPEVYERYVKSIILDDPALARVATNLLFGITKERTPHELIEAARGGEITFGGMLKQHRLQKRMSRRAYFDVIHPFLDPTGKHIDAEGYGQWESDKISIKSPEMARGLARAVGMEAAEDIRDFTAMALGRYIRDERINDEELLNRFRRKEIEIKDFIRIYREQHGLSQNELIRQSGIAAIGNWENNNQHPERKQLAEKFADYIGYKNQDREDFIGLVFKKRSYVDLSSLPDGPEKTPPEFLAAIKAGELTFGKALEQYRLQKKLGISEFFESIRQIVDPTGENLVFKTYSGWEADRVHVRDIDMARRLAKAVGFEAQEDIWEFGAIAMGRPVGERMSSAQLLDALRNEEISLSWFIQSYRQQRGLTLHEFKNEAGISAIYSWEKHNKPIIVRALAEKFADYIGYKDTDKADFIALSMKKRKQDGPPAGDSDDDAPGALGAATSRLLKGRNGTEIHSPVGSKTR